MAAPIKALCHPDRLEKKKGSGLCEACTLGAKKARALRSPEEVKQLQILAAMEGELTHLQTLTRAARAIVRERLPDYARLHYRAAEIAASRGDARPSEWALTAVQTPADGATIQPPAVAKAAGDGGIRVLIGVNMGGLPQESLAITSESID